MNKVFYLISLIFIVLILTVSCKKEKENEENSETINIGLIVPMSVNVDYSQEMINAAEIAISEINGNGKIFGKSLKLYVEDDANVPATAAVKANSLIDEARVVAIIAGSTSRCMSILNGACIPKNTILMSPTASSVAFSTMNTNNMFWRTCPSDAFQAKVAANFLRQTLDKTKIGVFYINSTWGRGLAEEFSTNFVNLGGTIVISKSFPEQSNYDNYDFKPKLDSLFAEKPEVIYLITNGPEGAKITTKINIEQYFTSSYKPLMMGCDGNRKTDFINNSPSSVIEGMYGTAPKAALNQQFIDTYKALYGITPSNIANNVYDNVYLIAYSMLAANSEAPTEIVKKMQEISTEGDNISINQFALAKSKIENGINIDYNGASGKIEFAPNGDVTSGTYEIWRIIGGQYTTISTISVP